MTSEGMQLKAKHVYVKACCRGVRYHCRGMRDYCCGVRYDYRGVRYYCCGER
jgi:hypothetical protein